METSIVMFVIAEIGFVVGKGFMQSALGLLEVYKFCEVAFDSLPSLDIKRSFYFPRDIKAGNILLGDDGTVQIAGDIFIAQTMTRVHRTNFLFCFFKPVSFTQHKVFILKTIYSVSSIWLSSI